MRSPSLSAETITQLQPRLRSFAHRTLHNEADAEDLTQDTLLAMLRAPAPFRGEASLPTFATAILKHKIADLVRARVTERRAQARIAAEMQCRADAGPDLSTSLAQRRRRDRFWPHLRAQLRALPAQTREAFVLRLLLDCDVDETSRRLGISANHTAVLTSRAKKQLRGSLDRAALEE
jgi:RNA polymerase sigma-70 factor (ECF subfamily)